MRSPFAPLNQLDYTGVLDPLMNTNPYAAPTAPANSPRDRGGRRLARTIGNAMLAAALLVLVYGAVAFWLIQWLPPNGGPSGRLPSLYVMGVGILGSIIGMVVRDLRSAERPRNSAGSPVAAIPTSVGILILVALVVALFVAIYRL